MQSSFQTNLRLRMTTVFSSFASSPTMALTGADRCVFLEIYGWFSLLRTDGVGNHDAQKSEKLLGWLSEKRPRKAWFAPPVIASQNISTRCNVRIRQMFRKFFLRAAVVVPNWWAHLLGKTNEMCGWNSVELREFRSKTPCCRMTTHHTS